MYFFFIAQQLYDIDPMKGHKLFMRIWWSMEIVIL